MRRWAGVCSVGVRARECGEWVCLCLYLCTHVYVQMCMPPCRHTGVCVCARVRAQGRVCATGMCMGTKVSRPQMASGTCDNITLALAPGDTRGVAPVHGPSKRRAAEGTAITDRSALTFLLRRFPGVSGSFSALCCSTENVPHIRHSGGRRKQP